VGTYTSDSPAETEAAAREFAADLPAGSVVALTGELGSGKTRFVKGIVAAIGSNVEVTSPTFTLVHEYTGGRVPVYHFDFFRLENQEAAERHGLDE
jgi:tRNA threonylcarbamoyladenosine biosynthesis protein TsaE